MPDPCLAVSCPLCRASAGEPCREFTREQRARPPHSRRIYRYLQERASPPVQGDLFAEVASRVPKAHRAALDAVAWPRLAA